ncbi:MAG: hypothetical protein K5751_06735 [Treponemataceae bacterium]|nr:hypothetical protein [Treponemataceae bacterium]
MTVTLRNVDAQFLNVIESLLSLRQNIQIETYEETPNELTQKVISDSEKGLNLSPIYTSTSDFMAALNG